MHRFIYYVRSSSLVPDQQYDAWERELRELVAFNPDIADTVAYDDDCPTKHVGSSNLWDYPRELQHVGDSLLKYGDPWAKGRPAEEPEVEPDAPWSPSLF